MYEVHEYLPDLPNELRHEGLAPLRHQGLVAAVLLAVGAHLDGPGSWERAGDRPRSAKHMAKTMVIHGKNHGKSW